MKGVRRIVVFMVEVMMSIDPDDNIEQVVHHCSLQAEVVQEVSDSRQKNHV